MFAGFISGDETVYREAVRRLKNLWGDISAESPFWPFDYTEYYRKEMGEGLRRSFAVFGRKIDPAELPRLKIEANEIEKVLSVEGKRRINIDPGYLTLAKVVLASTKDYSHRIYLGGGVFAELTLRYFRESFTALEWTYPDYRDEKTIRFFNDTRKYLFSKPKAAS